jgi:hypothetical protein
MCYKRILNQYYIFLGRSLFLKKENDFWDYHFKQTNNMGIKLNYFKIKLFMLIDIIKLFIYPVELFEKILRKIYGKNKMSETNQFSLNSIVSEYEYHQ